MPPKSGRTVLSWSYRKGTKLNHSAPSVLVDDYRDLTARAYNGRIEPAVQRTLVNALCIDGEWTVDAARELVLLAQSYGYFMLRNAAALAIALDIEDGDAGY